MRARIAALLLIAGALWAPATAGARTSPLDAHQRSVLQGIARDTWRFYAADVDPVTHLPLDNLGPGATRGAYTSAANIGVYLWAVVAARDLGLISTRRAERLASSTLDEVAKLKRFDGFLYQWYDTGNGRVLENPGQPECTSTTPAQDNCWFISAVDNGWYASGLVEVREALPALAGQADRLLGPMVRTWRTLPPQRCATDPDFSWQGQWPVAGDWQTYTDPQSGNRFDVWEGHYTYPGTSLTFVPTWAGGMFEGEMANLVVPETTWGTHSFGLDDVLNDVAMQRYLARDPVSWAARLYLSDETMSIG